jgi:FkbM family methyltransferase
MINKLRKLFELIRFGVRYPGVVIIGGPSFLQYIFKWRPAVGRFYSQEGQDAFVYLEFFRQISMENFPKSFLDVGCNHPVNYNNSYFFERHCNFKVLAIDPLDTYKAAWEEKRPVAKFEMCAVGDKDGSIEFDEAVGDGIESMYSSIAGLSNKNTELEKKARVVKVKTISEILSNNDLSDVGIMSMDIEGYEKKALLGIDFAKYRFHIILVENNSNSFFGDHDIRDILSAAGYVFYGRFWGLDDLFVHKSVINNAVA